MNPTLIDNMSWAMAEVYGACSDRLMVNLARHFKYIHTDKDAEQLFKYQARLLAQLGQIDKESADIIYMYMGGADASLRQALETAIVDAIKPVEKPLRDAAQKGLLNGVPTTPRPLSANMTQAFKAYYRQSADKLNLVNTVMLESTKAAYQATVADVVSRLNRSQEILNIGAGEVVTGVSTWNEAMHDAVRDMARNGLTGFVDHAGRRWSPEAYAAMDIRSTMFNTARAAVWERAEEYGADIYQVSSHNGARPLCYPWQGKLISRSGWTGDVEDIDGNVAHVYAESETSKGEPAGLFGINCRHYPMPFIPKFSALRYKGQDEEDNERTYAESQEQRGLERKLRGERLELELLKAQGASPDAIQAQELRVDKASDDIDRFCDETGRARRRSREYTPINADWPDKETYDAADFPTAVRDEINDFFRNNNDNNPPPPQAPINIGPDDNTPPSPAQSPAVDQTEATAQAQDEPDAPRAQVTPGPRHAEFTPAATIQEAEEKARQYVSNYGGKVSYRGIDIEYANTCNRVLGDINDTFGLKALESIQPMNMRSKVFQNSTSEAAYRWGTGDLFINPTFYKSTKTFGAHKAEIDKLTETVLNGADRLLQTATGRKRDYIEALVYTGRQCVSQSYDFVEGTFIHEMGHRLEDQMLRKQLMKAFDANGINFSDKLSESMHQYGGKISGYAISDSREYIAESFTAWWYGEGDNIDPIIRGVLEEAVLNE